MDNITYPSFHAYFWEASACVAAISWGTYFSISASGEIPTSKKKKKIPLSKKLQLLPVILESASIWFVVCEEQEACGANGKFKVWYLMIHQDKNGGRLCLLKGTGALQFLCDKWGIF